MLDSLKASSSTARAFCDTSLVKYLMYSVTLTDGRQSQRPIPARSAYQSLADRQCEDSNEGGRAMKDSTPDDFKRSDQLHPTPANSYPKRRLLQTNETYPHPNHHTMLTLLSRQAQPKLQHFRIIRRPQSSNRIPAHRTVEPSRTATLITTLRNIVEDLRMRIRSRIDEADTALTDIEARLVE